jgi:predicted house-cleaning noncanonical NTP pyrophosphatase (MazG superfamily)
MTLTRRFKIGTLVRDKMPDRIEKLGGSVEMCPLDPETHLHYLKLKLREEAEEVCEAENPKELKEEIADVLEVLYTLSKRFGLRWEHIEKERLQKRDNRGGFKKGTFVEFVEVESSDNSHPLIQYCLANPDKYPEVLDFKSEVS